MKEAKLIDYILLVILALIWSSAFFPKAPGEGKIVSYHQDNPYWQLTNEKVVTAWIALTNSNHESGALEIVPKSSNLGIINDLDVKDARASYLKGENDRIKKYLIDISIYHPKHLLLHLKNLVKQKHICRLQALHRL